MASMWMNHKAFFQRTSIAAAALGLLIACSSTPTGGDFQYRIPAQPEGSSGTAAKTGWATSRFAVAAANPLATDAGYQVLKAGGSAIDAAIAVQMVLTLVEPQSSGIGGGAFLMHWDGAKVRAYDGRETAPAAAQENLFIKADGKPMAFMEGVVGGRSAGVPGVTRMLELAHKQHGKLAWAKLFEPAITLAEQGFPVSHRLHTLLKAETALKTDPVARAFYYQADGEPHPIGYRLKNPALAAVLKAIANQGANALHTGAVARDIVAKVRNHPSNPGTMTEQDLASYQPVVREPICTDWQAQRVCGFPPPSSGHLAIMQILGILDRLPTEGRSSPLVNGLPDANYLHRYTEAARLAYADRAQYLGDPAFVSPPAGSWTSLLDDGYLKRRAALIGEQSMKTAQPGDPGPVKVSYAPQPEQPEYGTSHISIVDAQGHALAMTTTIEAGWGARVMSHGGTGLPGGFLLNNELTDFSFAPADASGKPIANRVQPGKRPRSSMSPTLVFDKATGQLIMSAGSPGGAAIIHFTAKTMLGSLRWGLNAQQAINLPNFGTFNGPTVLEAKGFPAATVDALKARGHQVNEIEMVSGLQALQRTPTGWFGGADPRREGIVLGD